MKFVHLGLLCIGFSNAAAPVLLRYDVDMERLLPPREQEADYTCCQRLKSLFNKYKRCLKRTNKTPSLPTFVVYAPTPTTASKPAIRRVKSNYA